MLKGKCEDSKITFNKTKKGFKCRNRTPDITNKYSILKLKQCKFGIGQCSPRIVHLSEKSEGEENQVECDENLNILNNEKKKDSIYYYNPDFEFSFGPAQFKLDTIHTEKYNKKG